MKFQVFNLNTEKFATNGQIMVNEKEGSWYFFHFSLNKFIDLWIIILLLFKYIFTWFAISMHALQLGNDKICDAKRNVWPTQCLLFLSLNNILSTIHGFSFMLVWKCVWNSNAYKYIHTCVHWLCLIALI